MKVILVGYGEMLRSLASGILNSQHEIVGVLRQETILRNKISRFFFDYLSPSADYLFIKNHSLHEINARSVNSENFRKAVKKLKADVIIVGSWSEKFSAQTINTIPNGIINVHPSLLPKYRGPNPYLQVILNNEQMSGITFHLMNIKYDSGSILHQKEIPVLPDDTGGSLKIRCCEIARNEVIFLLDNFKSRLINQRSQNETEATYQPQISIKETILDFENETAEETDKRIRAFSPWISCYIPIKNEFFKFQKHKIKKEKVSGTAGTIISKNISENSISVICKDNSVMKFYDLKINRPFAKYLSKYFFNKLIDINNRAV